MRGGLSNADADRRMETARESAALDEAVRALGLVGETGQRVTGAPPTPYQERLGVIVRWEESGPPWSGEYDPDDRRMPVVRWDDGEEMRVSPGFLTRA